MAVTADQVVIEVLAKVDGSVAALTRYGSAFDRTMTRSEVSARRAEEQIRRSAAQVKRTLIASASVIGGAFGGRELINLADGYTRFTNQLRLAGIEGEALGQTQEDLFNIAQKYGIQLETLGTLFSRSSQAAKDLGANQAQLLKFTSGVAAALKVQGGSASESQGALLQLSQALGSGVVRAEEFNSIMEGARPIAQAVANGIDRFGGSISKLRAEILKGDMASQEFFQGALKGFAEVEQQADKANLTIGASFVTLNNALGKYIGEADQSLSATQRVSQGIAALAGNLESIIPALGLIVAFFGVKYVGAIGAATVATTVKAAADVRATLAAEALAAANAQLGIGMNVGAAAAARATASVTGMSVAMGTATGVARGLGASMLAAFGGPVGLAIGAVTLGVVYYITTMGKATEASGRYASTTRRLADTQEAHRKVILDLASATDKERKAALDAAQAARSKAIEDVKAAKAALARAMAERELAASIAAKGVANSTALPRAGGPDAVLSAINSGQRLTEQADANAWAAIANLRESTKRLDELNAAVVAPVQTASTTTTDKKDKKKPKGRDQADIDRQVQDEQERLDADILRAKAEYSGSIQDRAEAEIASLDADRNATIRSIKADKDLSEAQKASLIAAVDDLHVRRAAVIDQEAAREQAKAAADVIDSRLATEQELLGYDGDTARTAAQRRAIELRILELAFKRERQALEEVAKNSKDAGERQRAQERLDALPGLEAGARRGVEKRTQGPLEAYLDSLPKTAEEVNEAMEYAAANGLQSLTDGITDAIMGAKSLGDVFKSVANQIIADLIRIAVQKVVVNAIGSAIGLPGFAGGGSISVGGGGLPGFASGGSLFVRGNGGIDRNLLSINGKPVARVNQGERIDIVPQGKAIRPVSGAIAAVRPNVTVVSAPTFDLRHAVTTPQLMREVDRISQINAQRAALAMGQGVMKAMPARMGRFQRDGT